MLLSLLATLLFAKACHSLTLASLSVTTTPEEIVEAQLASLQKGDTVGVFAFASPGNKANVNNDQQMFDSMVRQPVYLPLINHKESNLLLTTSSSRDSSRSIWKGLVRVVPQEQPRIKDEEDDDDEDDVILLEKKKMNYPTTEFWWIMSRCNSGLHKGCFMVDAVMPHNA